ncbi:hypothetical protein E2C01_027242 [Portunus trituberculatus]|uniref:Uncharacterized protein n=1 Tax=Portunus trituberculatus TaxID=210409 RepID=A0A5B7EKB4_PORTR|nr:hypothetical protein [Portunus trituberculatus]
MKINNSKTKFFVTNGTQDDKQQMVVDDIVVEACERYEYLGSPFTANGSSSTTVKLKEKKQKKYLRCPFSFPLRRHPAGFYSQVPPIRPIPYLPLALKVIEGREERKLNYN